MGSDERGVLAALGAGLTHALWMSAVVAAWAAVSLRVLRGAPAAWRHALAFAAMVAMAGAVPLGVLAARGTAQAWHGWLALVWLVGVAVKALRLAQGLALVRALRGRCRPLAGPWAPRFGALARALGVRRTVALAASDDIEVPCSVGALRPAVLLPADLAPRLGPAAFDAVAAHELGHVRRHDYAWNLLQQLCEAALCFHPARPWLSRVIALERERSCDALAAAIVSPVALARGLARLESRRAAPRVEDGAPADLLPRVQDLLESGHDHRRTSAMPALLVACAGVVGMGVMLGWSAALPLHDTAGVAMPWMAAAGLGLVVGVRHALEPDHLAAVATLVTRERSATAAARLGAAWGMGHATTLLLVGSVLVLARTAVPASVNSGLEALVAAMLLVMGGRSLLEARRRASDGPVRMHAHGDEVHSHATGGAHLHVGPWALARRPFLVGTVHGLAGSGALTALAVSTLPDAPAQVAFMLVFGAGSACGMAAVAGMAGWPIARLLPHRTAVAALSAASGVLAVMVGLSWGWTALVVLAKGVSS